ncbi:MAG: Flp pilus assembly protein CpaB [Acidobacteria bacterium]|nr:Flp pilus assembly protein CpaB [Acidobacteriota bacterium]
MDKRFLTVLGVSLLFALVVSGLFYKLSAGGVSKPAAPVEMKDLVIAAKPLGPGVTIKPADVKISKVPASQLPRNSYSKVDEVIERSVINPILLDEPVLEGRLAARGAGYGLGPMIPAGMRAVAVRVNEVVGVSGFTLPGMRVDVLVTGRPPNSEETKTTTILQNILILSAGQAIQADSRGQPINAQTVTLLVTPPQAEALTLAGNEGKIQLVLRGGNDHGLEKTGGSGLMELYGERRPPPPRERVIERSPPVVLERIKPPIPVVPDQIVVIRGAKRTVETVGVTPPSGYGAAERQDEGPPPAPAAAPAVNDEPPNQDEQARPAAPKKESGQQRENDRE